MRKWALLSLLPVLAAFVLFVDFALTEINREIFAGKLTEKKLQVDFIADSIDLIISADNDWDEYNYTAMLANIVENMDNPYGVFAALYDGELNLMTERFGDDVNYMFDPRDYPDFIDSVGFFDEGVVTLPYGGGKRSEIHLYYRKIPTGAGYSNRLTIVSALTDYSMVTQPYEILKIAIAAFAAATFAFIAAAILTILKRQEASLDV